MGLDLGPKNEIRMTSDVDSDRLVSSLNMLKYGLNIIYYEIFSVSSCAQMHGAVVQHGSRVSFWGWLKDSLLE